MATTNLGRVRFNMRGDYNPSADPLYSLLDLVSDGGGSFVYINDTPSNEPTSSASHWQQIAEKGDTGPSAYDAAVAGGYTGTEAEFNAANAGIEAAKDSALGAAETANEAAENAETAAYRSMLWRKTASGNLVSVYPVPESPLYPKVSGTFTQEGTGDPSPENIRPITPWLASGAQVKVNRTGKNLIRHGVTETYLSNGVTITLNSDDSLTFNGTATSGIITPKSNKVLMPAGKYTLSGNPNASGVTLFLRSSVDGVTEGSYVTCTNNVPATLTLSSPAYLYIYASIGSGATVNSLRVYPQVEFGETATPYEPYSGTEITLTAPQEIPAGWMDSEGKGQVTLGKIIVDGSMIASVDAFYANTFRALSIMLPNGAVGETNKSCNIFKTEGGSNDVEHFRGSSANAGLIFFINKSRIPTWDDGWNTTQKRDAARAWFNANPATAYYQLATPVTLAPTIAPLTALPQLDRITPRQNVLTSSTGNIELTYAKSPIREADELATAIAALS